MTTSVKRALAEGISLEPRTGVTWSGSDEAATIVSMAVGNCELTYQRGFSTISRSILSALGQ